MLYAISWHDLASLSSMQLSWRHRGLCLTFEPQVLVLPLDLVSVLSLRLASEAVLTLDSVRGGVYLYGEASLLDDEVLWDEAVGYWACCA